MLIAGSNTELCVHNCSRKGVIAVAQDPVCGTDIDEKSAEGLSVFRGEPYYFCCSGCHNAFDQNPEKYALAPKPPEDKI